MSKSSESAVFALKAWTIKKNGEKFYISPSVAFHDRQMWSKGYRSLHAACSAIARKLAEEWTRRSERRQTSARQSKRR
jgi:hypothetical protein